MKIIIEIGDESAKLIGKILFVLGGFFLLMALLASITAPLFVSFILIVIGSVILFSGLFLMIKIRA